MINNKKILNQKNFINISYFSNKRKNSLEILAFENKIKF
jgi:hypothetical protein